MLGLTWAMVSLNWNWDLGLLHSRDMAKNIIPNNIISGRLAGG